MITINITEDTAVALTRVDHCSNAESAAQALFWCVHEESKVHGGDVRMVSLDGSHGVSWSSHGQWADAYVVSDGADAKEFSAHATDMGSTVLFTDLD